MPSKLGVKVYPFDEQFVLEGHDQYLKVLKFELDAGISKAQTLERVQLSPFAQQ